MKSSALVFIALGALAGCDNMKRQPNVHPLEPSSHYSDGAAERPRPGQVVSRGQPFASDPFESGFREGAPLTDNPLTVTAELLARGRARFNIYCAVCHGADGYGTGIVVPRGFPPPPSLHAERLRAAAAGQLFDAITRGYGVMMPLADRLTTSDRWAVVAYVRALQRSQHATLADVPEREKAALLRP